MLQLRHESLAEALEGTELAGAEGNAQQRSGAMRQKQITAGQHQGGA